MAQDPTNTNAVQPQPSSKQGNPAKEVASNLDKKLNPLKEPDNTNSDKLRLLAYEMEGKKPNYFGVA